MLTDLYIIAFIWLFLTVMYIVGIALKIYSKRRKIIMGIMLGITVTVIFFEPMMYRINNYNKVVKMRDLAQEILDESYHDNDKELIDKALKNADDVNHLILILQTLNNVNWEWDIMIDDRIEKLEYVKTNYDGKERV